MRNSVHPLVFLLGSLLLSVMWLVLREPPPTARPNVTAFGTARPAPRPRVERKTIELDSETLSRYVGSYRLDESIEVAIELDAGRLFAIAQATPRYELEPTSEKEFYLPDLDVDIAFDVDATGRAVSFTAKLPTGTITAKRAR